MRDNIGIRTADTDCLVITLGCCQMLDIGVQNCNDLRCIGVDSIYWSSGEKVCWALSAYHVIAGFTCFSWKGKIWPIQKYDEFKLESLLEIWQNLTNIKLRIYFKVINLQANQYSKQSFESKNQVSNFYG